MIDIEGTRARLKEAEEAYHALMIGGAGRVYVDQSGERVEYVAANREALQLYIRDLKLQLAAAGGGERPRRFGPISIRT